MDRVLPLSGTERNPFWPARFLHNPERRYSHRDRVYHKQRQTMKDTKNLSPAVLLHIAQTLIVPIRGLVAVIELLDDGGTVPFIARYRKEATGNLDEVQILNIEEKLAYFRELAERRETILRPSQSRANLRTNSRPASKPRWTRANWKTCTCPTNPSAAPKPPSRARRGLSRLRSIFGLSREPRSRLRVCRGVCECGAGRSRR